MMEIKVLLYNFGKDKQYFVLERGVRPWDIILMASKGSFSLSFPNEGQTYLFNAYEIAYIPANTPFIRKVIEPLDFYQFNFQRLDDDIICKGLIKGKLCLPQEHVKALIESTERLSFFSVQHELSHSILSYLLTENYIFSNNNERAIVGMSREIAHVIQYINDHLNEKIDIATLAKQVYLSHTGLIWKFKKELGITPSEYLIATRMQYAKQLLLENDCSIGEIAERCGYTNVYYFSNAFRAYTGKSASEFRKTYLN